MVVAFEACTAGTANVVANASTVHRLNRLVGFIATSSLFFEVLISVVGRLVFVSRLLRTRAYISPLGTSDAGRSNLKTGVRDGRSGTSAAARMRRSNRFHRIEAFVLLQE